MAISRASLLREPGQMIFDGSTFYSQGDLVVKPVVTMAEIATSVHGTVDSSRVTNRLFTVSGILAGEWEDLPKLFAPMALRKGASVFGATDKPLVVHGRGDTRITFTAAAITKPPVIIGRAGATMFGAFEATAIIGNNAGSGLAASYYTIDSAPYPGDTAFDPTKLLTLPLTAAWGGDAPWSSFLSRDGWTITPEVTLVAEDVDGLGTVDMKVENVTCSAVATPAGITLAAAIAKLGFGTAMGARRETADSLILTAAGVYIELTAAVMTDTTPAFGNAPLVGATTWKANRKWVEGVLQPLLVVGTEAPEA